MHDDVNRLIISEDQLESEDRQLQCTEQREEPEEIAHVQVKSPNLCRREQLCQISVHCTPCLEHEHTWTQTHKCTLVNRHLQQFWISEQQSWATRG